MREFSEMLDYFNDKLKNVFACMDSDIASRINEVRIRRNREVILVIKNSSYFIDYNGDIYDYPSVHSVFVGTEDFDEIFMNICDYSIYNNMDNLKKGFITLPDGSRVGVAGSAVMDDGRIISVKDITSLNFRIPKQITGCADELLNFLYVNAFPSIIVAGRPNSGKTTLLRDIARGLGGGFNNKYTKIAVIDERNEIAGKKNGEITMNLGYNTDVLSSYSKADGIEIATRTLSPEMIICDEISTVQEVESILYSFSSGISFALSVHISTRRDLLHKPIINILLKTKQFSYIVLLNDYTYKPEIIEAEEIYNEICRNDQSDTFHDSLGVHFV